MAVSIRLTRHGRRHLPFYHIAVFNSRTRRDGKPVETLGFYDPESKTEQVRLDNERAAYWLGVGAQPSETVTSILKAQGVDSALLVKARKKPSKPKVAKNERKIKAEKKRSVKRGRKARTANSKTRAEKKKA